MLSAFTAAATTGIDVGIDVASFGTTVSSAATALTKLFTGEGNALFLLVLVLVLLLVADADADDGLLLTGVPVAVVVAVLRGVPVRGVVVVVTERGVGSLNLFLVRALLGEDDARSGGGARSCLRRTILGGEGEGAAVVVVVAAAGCLAFAFALVVVVVPSATP